ncbi:hypothetical protein [Nocardioides sp. GY 10127]|uniref:hypothetical protein n=1 Tax=Nocardioides sp. GY 10127 TaxID=2569762 RepID=UPI0010A7FBCB|nr:hypothetical protein [Nocardioides sp. GY 10127]TIC81842.1 hypothetical protein E8D37_11755 [Nocardioides sp. GY 10127]
MGPVRFTENEMTRAMEGAAKSVLAGQREVRKGGRDVEDVWHDLGRFGRYQLLAGLADQVLPVLTALPDVEVEPGTRPTFTEEQVRAAVEEGLDGVGRLQRGLVLKARIALVEAALAAVPPRIDPDGLLTEDSIGEIEIPDDLSGL